MKSIILYYDFAEFQIIKNNIKSIYLLLSKYEKLTHKEIIEYKIKIIK